MDLFYFNAMDRISRIVLVYSALFLSFQLSAQNRVQLTPFMSFDVDSQLCIIEDNATEQEIRLVSQANETIQRALNLFYRPEETTCLVSVALYEGVLEPGESISYGLMGNHSPISVEVWLEDVPEPPYGETGIPNYVDMKLDDRESSIGLSGSYDLPNAIMFPDPAGNTVSVKYREGSVHDSKCRYSIRTQIRLRLRPQVGPFAL